MITANHIALLNRQQPTTVNLRFNQLWNRYKPSKVHFRISNGGVAPYVVLDYSNRGTMSPVKEVILGPKNDNSESNIDIFLNTIGMRDVTVRRSIVPYR